MAKNLRNYDFDYAHAKEAAAPLLTQYPGNCIFLLLAGDIEQKLGHTEAAAAKFRAAQRVPGTDVRGECSSAGKEALASLGVRRLGGRAVPARMRILHEISGQRPNARCASHQRCGKLCRAGAGLTWHLPGGIRNRPFGGGSSSSRARCWVGL